MTATPTFSDADAEAGRPRADFIEVDRALESMRDAGFDLMAAIGEPVDNSIEASAKTIRIVPTYSKDKKHITTIAFADDGRGIEMNVLPSVLKMGFSTRYNQRKGLGRFGVGLKLAALSVGERIEVYTKPAGGERYYRAFLDLDLIRNGKQEYIEAVEVAGWPEEYAGLMVDEKAVPFASGTLVLWAHIDRLSSGGTYGTSLDTKLADLRKFIARAYREFIDQRLTIILDDKRVTLHDPLFLKDNPRVLGRYRGRPESEIRGRIVDEADLEIEGHKVHVTVTLAPEIFRPKKQAGGNTDIDGKDIREFQINKDNEGRISIVRNGREIYYDIIPRMLPSGVDKAGIDRYIGIEVTFPAELDAYFQVRHVKRGAEPVSKLREELRKWLARPISSARNQIRDHWRQASVEDLNPEGRNDSVLDAVERAEQTAPKGQAALDVTYERQEALIEELLEDLNIDPEEGAKADRIRQMIQEHPMTIVDGAWPGKELMEIDHLNNKAVVRLNHRHPFIRDIYDPLRELAGRLPGDQDAGELFDLVQRTSNALDVLFLAYAKAENLHRDPSIFDDLRSYWGQHTQAYMKELAKEQGA
ncbi:MULTISPECIES: ATP-binding protein [Mycobacteroides]|uniref:ATP-binding protein n=1 Tax=Mycobacteroides TaxID=670516 RepID=UPI000C2688FE|nr:MULTISPECIES: ATP-binding protein [Mycobacteroides]MBF9328408.1 ATP-binding protein [Mycobacteroides chelonae]MBF9422586.1 ATP-binding protein [Mycobacteroides chelonae]